MEDVVFGHVPRRVVARGLDVEAVLVNEGAAVDRAQADEGGGEDGEHEHDGVGVEVVLVGEEA